jgi:spore germination cell wall hydrolase CwlJ-like protein
MHQMRIMTCLAAILLAGQVSGADRTGDAEAALSKAEILEQAASAEGGEQSPSPSETITKPEAQAVDPSGEKSLNDAVTCLSRTIYWEAKGEGTVGMEAIANVVMNRLGHEGFPNSVCEIVKQGRQEGACQFSWWCDGRSDDVEEEDPYGVATDTARKALNRELADRTDGALYFHHRRLSPAWASEYIKTAEIGGHIFYKPDGGTAK